MGNLIRPRTKGAFQIHSTANMRLWKTEGREWALGEGKDGAQLHQGGDMSAAPKDEPMELPVLKGGWARTLSSQYMLVA